MLPDRVSNPPLFREAIMKWQSCSPENVSIHSKCFTLNNHKTETELQISRGTEDKSKIIFLMSQ